MQLAIGVALGDAAGPGHDFQSSFFVDPLPCHDGLNFGDDRYHPRGAFLDISRGVQSNQHRNFALRRPLLQILQGGTDSSAQKLFVDFGHFPGNDNLPFAKYFPRVLKHFRQSMWRLIENERSGGVLQFLQSLPALAFLAGQESQKAELIDRQSGSSERRHEGGGAGNGNHGDAVSNGKMHQAEARV